MTGRRDQWDMKTRKQRAGIYRTKEDGQPGAFTSISPCFPVEFEAALTVFPPDSRTTTVYAATDQGFTTNHHSRKFRAYHPIAFPAFTRGFPAFPWRHGVSRSFTVVCNYGLLYRQPRRETTQWRPLISATVASQSLRSLRVDESPRADSLRSCRAALGSAATVHRTNASMRLRLPPASLARFPARR